MGKDTKKLNRCRRRGRRKNRGIAIIFVGLFIFLCVFLAVHKIHCYEGDSLVYDGENDRDLRSDTKKSTAASMMASLGLGTTETSDENQESKDSEDVAEENVTVGIKEETADKAAITSKAKV